MGEFVSCCFGSAEEEVVLSCCVRLQEVVQGDCEVKPVVIDNRTNADIIPVKYGGLAHYNNIFPTLKFASNKCHFTNTSEPKVKPKPK